MHVLHSFRAQNFFVARKNVATFCKCFFKIFKRQKMQDVLTKMGERRQHLAWLTLTYAIDNRQLREQQL